MKNLFIFIVLISLSFTSLSSIYESVFTSKKYLIIYGTIEFDSINEKKPWVTLELKDLDTKIKYLAYTDSAGDFSFNLPTKIGERKFMLKVEAPFFFPINIEVVLPVGLFEINLNELVDLEMKTFIICVNEVTINPIYYESGSFLLDSSALFELNKLVSVLKENPTLFIDIGSHTDCIGSVSSNLFLSKKRSEVVVKYLTSMEISINRLTIFNFGESEPINSCKCDEYYACSEEDKKENRRTEFRINDKTKTDISNGF